MECAAQAGSQPTGAHRWYLLQLTSSVYVFIAFFTLLLFTFSLNTHLLIYSAIASASEISCLSQNYQKQNVTDMEKYSTIIKDLFIQLKTVFYSFYNVENPALKYTQIFKLWFQALWCSFTVCILPHLWARNSLAQFVQIPHFEWYRIIVAADSLLIL